MIELCRKCRGECCRGEPGRFNRLRLAEVQVTAEELAAMREVAPVPVRSERGGIARGAYYVLLPCPIQGEHGCLLPYYRRPLTCRLYYCAAALEEAEAAADGEVLVKVAIQQ